MLFFTVSSSFSEPTVRSLVYIPPRKSHNHICTHSHVRVISPIHIQCIRSPRATRFCLFFSLRNAAREQVGQVFRSAAMIPRRLSRVFFQDQTLYVHVCGDCKAFPVGDHGGISWRRSLGNQIFALLVPLKGLVASRTPWAHTEYCCRCSEFLKI